MALILSTLDIKKTWQPVTVKTPAAKGLVTQKFDVQLIWVDDEEFKEIASEKTIKECLELWLIGTKGLQADEKNAKEMEFTPELKATLIKSDNVSASIWEAVLLARSGGRAKN